MAPRLHCVGFGDWKHQLKTVRAGQSDIVWDFYVTGGYTAFIDQLIAIRGDNQLGEGGSYIDWYVDGVREDRINREIPLNNPKEFNPPLVANRRIHFRAVNPTSSDHIFEVVCDGQICKPL